MVYISFYKKCPTGKGGEIRHDEVSDKQQLPKQLYERIIENIFYRWNWLVIHWKYLDCWSRI